MFVYLYAKESSFYPGGSCDEETFKQWTSRRPYKERKQLAKTRNNFVLPHPEIIFYGQNSGVIGLQKKELFRSLDQNDYANCGYDKVNSVTYQSLKEKQRKLKKTSSVCVCV